MKVSTDIPKIFARCQQLFGVSWDNGIAIAYGDTIYSAYPLGFSVEAHEEVHLLQQATFGNVDQWWDKYLTDKHFRLLEESQAYRTQAEFIRTHCKDKNEVARRLHQLAKDLSGAMYGSLCTYSHAKDILNG